MQNNKMCTVFFISTKQEAERRQRQVETLQSQYVHLQSQFMQVSTDNNDRQELLGNGKSSYWQGDDDDDDEPLAGFRPSSSSREPTVEDLRKQQTRILEDQNEGLDALSKVISRQKHLAIRIGDEMDDQNGANFIRIIFFFEKVPLHTIYLFE